MTDSRAKLTAQQLQEAKLKFWKICDYASALLYIGEHFDNWCVGVTDRTDNLTDEFATYKKNHPNLDLNTWKEFKVADEAVAREVEHMMKERGFNVVEGPHSDNANIIYVFRKDRSHVQGATKKENE